MGVHIEKELVHQRAAVVDHITEEHEMGGKGSVMGAERPARLELADFGEGASNDGIERHIMALAGFNDAHDIPREEQPVESLHSQGLQGAPQLQSPPPRPRVNVTHEIFELEDLRLEGHEEKVRVEEVFLPGALLYRKLGGGTQALHLYRNLDGIQASAGV